MSYPRLDRTHERTLRSWVPGADGHREFPVQNLPYGVFSPPGGSPRPGVAIGERIVDLAAIVGLLPEGLEGALQAPLNQLLALPAGRRSALRARLSTLLTDTRHASALEPHLHDRASCELHLPARIGDYSDFYAGIHHAVNAGKQFRPDQPLLPNYKFVPIGYHGRASSVRPSGVGVVRPSGQQKSPEAEAPVFGPTRRLDFELELGVWVGAGNALGAPIPIAQAPDHIAGLCLLNDWSARDLQGWEYQPLGPFLAKSFHTTISPWVVTAEALAPFWIAQPVRAPGDPRPLDYLWHPEDQNAGALSIELEVSLLTRAMRAARQPPLRLSRVGADNLYWTIAQLVTHHASNGCNLAAGDLLGTGTVSAPTRNGLGSLLELTRGGREKMTLPNGETRAFLEDGDEVILSAHAHAEGAVSIGFGECSAVIEPSAS